MLEALFILFIVTIWVIGFLCGAHYMEEKINKEFKERWKELWK